MTKPDITAFLRARIVDDKADALAEIAAGYNGYADPGWDSDRVLAECGVKLLIVELHAPRADGEFYHGSSTGSLAAWATVPAHADLPDGPACQTCGEWSEYGVPWPCPTIRLLASLYADHPDYDESWRP